MKAVYKYRLEGFRTTLHMPKGAQIPTVQKQNDTPCIWALVDEGAETEPRIIDMYGTGHLIDDRTPVVYLGTIQSDSLVWHFFETTKK